MKFQISTRNKISLSTQKELYNSEVLLQANLVVVVFFVEIETKQKECYNLIYRVLFSKKNFFFQIRIRNKKKATNIGTTRWWHAHWSDSLVDTATRKQ